MATSMAGAALSVVGAALVPFKDSVLEKWAASVKLGANVDDLELELLSVRALLEHAAGREIADNSALKELLVMLQDLAYDADDVLDELDYFRVQDDLDGTSEAAAEHAKGCACDLALHVHHTARDVAKQICCLPAAASLCDMLTARISSNRDSSSEMHTNQLANREINGWKAKLTTSTSSCCDSSIHALGKCFPCSSTLPCVRNDDNHCNRMHNSQQSRHYSRRNPPKLKFNRVEASKRMKHVIEQLRHVREIVFATITALGPNWSTVPVIAQGRLTTTSKSTEQELFGRNHIMDTIIDNITQGEHSGEALRVIPVLGPGGIGKTTLVQHIYEKVRNHFQVRVWKCVSFNFNANKLIEEIEKLMIREVEGENMKGTEGELMVQILKNKRFLIVLDDIWDCRNEDEWIKLLEPFQKSQVLGNVIIVTTRLPAQAKVVKRSVDHPPIELKALKDEELKELLLHNVFSDDQSRNNHPDLLDLVDKIIARLKGSPLAAKTVGKLLKKQLELVHWERVLDSKEWEQLKDKDSIMPALKLSYDYLPSQLQRCFSYCALFPQDYEFKIEELVNFWIGLDVLHQMTKIKD